MTMGSAFERRRPYARGFDMTKGAANGKRKAKAGFEPTVGSFGDAEHEAIALRLTRGSLQGVADPWQFQSWAGVRFGETGCRFSEDRLAARQVACSDRPPGATSGG